MKIIPSPRCCLAALLLAPFVPARAAEPSYHLLKEVPIAGEGGWDYLAVNPGEHRLYVSHATKVVVLDTVSDTVVGEIADTPGVHGIAFAPGRAFTSNGKENKVSVAETGSLKTLAKVATGEKPDAILSEPGQKEIYAFNGKGQSATVFTAATGEVVATIPLGGKPEFAQADPAAGRVYNNLEDKNEVAVIDTKTHAVVQHWSVAPGDEPSGMEIDTTHHRLFLGCGNAKLIVLDSTDGHQVAVLPAGKGIDAVGFDAATRLVFTSNGADGTATIYHEDTPDQYTLVQTLKTEPAARTLAIDPVSHKLYLVTAKFAPAAEGSGKRPAMLPGTFKLLVYGLAP